MLFSNPILDIFFEAKPRSLNPLILLVFSLRTSKIKLSKRFLVKKMENLREFMLIYIGYCLKCDGHYFSYTKLVRALKEMGIKHHLPTLRKEFSMIKKEKLIEFKTRYRKNYPVLTQKGRLEIRTRLDSKHFDPWDGLWYMVLFDIAESDSKYRALLKQAMLKMGFYPLQRSAFISPHNQFRQVRRLATDWGICQDLKFIVAREINDVSDTFEERLAQINSRYVDFIGKTNSLKRDLYWPLRAKILEKDFAQIWADDPRFPKKLLGENWQGDEAYKTFKEISNSY